MSIKQLADCVEGIDADVAMMGKISEELEYKMERHYSDLKYYAGRYIEHLRNLAKQARQARQVGHLYF
jgi:hypothetical protein